MPVMNVSDIDRETAMEMARVGVAPSDTGPEEEPVGHRFEMAGQTFVVTGYTDRAGFMAAVLASGVPQPWRFKDVPDGMYFQRISTD